MTMQGTGEASPEISFVVPTYDRSHLVKRAVRSIVDQGMANLEVIVVDDASPDPVRLPAELADDPRVRLVRHNDNRGAAAARNSGAREARGIWLSFLDDDDMLLPGTLRDRLAFAAARHRESGNDLLVVGCGFVYVDDDERPLFAQWPRPSRGLADFASGCWFGAGSCVLVRREPFLERVGPQDEQLHRLEDLDWFLRAALHGAQLVTSPGVAVAIRRHAGGRISRVFPAADRIQEVWRVAGLSGRVRGRLLAYLDLERAAAAWRDGQRRQMIRLLIRSWLRVPRLSLHLSPGWQRIATPRIPP